MAKERSLITSIVANSVGGAAGAGAARVVGGALGPITVPPDLSVAIDDAGAGNLHAGLLVHVDQGTGPFHLDPGHARGPHGIADRSGTPRISTPWSTRKCTPDFKKIAPDK